MKNQATFGGSTDAIYDTTTRLSWFAMVNNTELRFSEAMGWTAGLNGTPAGSILLVDGCWPET